MLPIAAAAVAAVVAVGRWLTAAGPSSSGPASAGWRWPSAWPPPDTGSSCSSATRSTGGKLAARRPRRVHVRRRAVVAHAAPRVRRAVPGRRHDVGRRGRPRAARPAVPLPLARRRLARGARRPDGDGRRVRGVRPGRRRGVAALRRARPAHLGRQRAVVLRRPDERAAGSCCGGCARRATCSTIDPLRTLHAPGRRALRRPAPRAVGRSVRHLLGLVARTGRRRRWPASPTSSPATAAGTRVGGLDALRVALQRVAESLGVEVRPRRRCRPHRRPRRRGRPASSWPTARRWRRRSSSPTPTPSTSTATCCPTTGRCAGCGGPSRSTSGFVLVAAVRGRHAGHRPPQRVVRRRRPGRVRRAGGRADGRRPDDLRLRLGGHRPDPGAGGRRELVPAAQRAGRASSSTATPRAGSCSTRSPPAASTCATAVAWTSTLTPSDLAARVPGARRGDLRHVVERSAGRVPCARATGARSRGLYLVGGSSHPGGGLPLVAMSARIVADMVAADGRAAVMRRRWRSAGRAGRRRRPSALRSIARAARRSAARSDRGGASASTPISVVVPARDEATRHRTAARRGRRCTGRRRGRRRRRPVDRRHGGGRPARRARPSSPADRCPAGWVGKAWALQQGLEAATGEWVVLLDADTRPSPALPAALVARATTDGLDLLSVAGRFECPTAPLRWLHPALLTTLVYRSAPPGAVDAGPGAPSDGERAVHGRPPARRCSPPAGSGPSATTRVEDVALVRTMATAGFAVGFLDASDLLTVRMYETAAEAWRGWGRSLSLPGVDPPAAPAGPAGRRHRRPGAAAGAPGRPAGPTPSTSCCSPSASARWPARPAPTGPAARPTGCRRPPTSPPSPPSPAARSPAARPGAAAPTDLTLLVPLSGTRTSRSVRSRRAAVQKRRPTNDISTPVAAVRRGPSTTSWTSGKAATATRMPLAPDDVARHPTAPDPERRSPRWPATARSAAPPNVATARPPRKRANTGQAWPTIAAPAPTTAATTRPGPATARPMAAAASALGHVAGEHRPGSSPPERLPGVPVAGVAVADRRAGRRRAGG